MENRIVVERALFDKLLAADPMLIPPEAGGLDGVWVRVKTFVESEKGFDEVINLAVRGA